MTENNTRTAPPAPLLDVVGSISRWMHPLLAGADNLDAEADRMQASAAGDPRRFARADRCRGHAHRLRQFLEPLRETVADLERLHNTTLTGDQR